MHLDLLEITKGELLDQVGKYAIPVETVFCEEMTVGELLKELQGKEISHEVSYFYCVDQKNHLCGVVATRSLLFSKPEVLLKSISSKETIHVYQTDSVETALSLMSKHKLFALPVIDYEGHLWGLFELPKETIISQKNGADTRLSRDIFQLIGLTVDQGKLSSSLKEFRYRMPWLLCNLIAGLTCAFIANMYTNLLQEIVAIAIFIPLVLTLGESVSMQSITLSLQFLSNKKIPWKRFFKRLIIESKTSLLLGATCALLVAIIYLIMNPAHIALFAITTSIFISMIVATMCGSILPVLLHSLKIDPKVAAGPVVLMITDVVVTAIYLSISSWMLLTI